MYIEREKACHSSNYSIKLPLITRKANDLLKIPVLVLGYNPCNLLSLVNYSWSVYNIYE